MNWFKRLKVKQKIAMSTFIVIILMTILAALSIKFILFPCLIDEIAKRGTTICQSIIKRGRMHITEHNKAKLLDLLFTEKWMEPHVEYIFILDESSNVIAHTFLSPFPKYLIGLNPLSPGKKQNTRLIETPAGAIYDTVFEVYEGIHPLAIVRVGLNKKYPTRIAYRLMGSLVAIFVFITSLTLVLTHWFSLQITNPILHLSKVAHKLSVGNFEADKSLKKVVRCWDTHDCHEIECPAFNMGDVPCWFLDNTIRKRTEGNAIIKCSQCEVYRENVGDEIDQLMDDFYYMMYRIGIYQSELHKTNDDLKRMNSNYISMLGFVTHELKAPIANAIMSARALHQRMFGSLNKTQDQMIELIYRNLDQSLDMVRNYLDLSRIEKEEMSFQPAPMQLRKDVVQPVLDDQAAIIEELGMQVVNMIEDDVRFEADQDLLRIIYCNLISNACNYGKKHGVIQLSAIDKGDRYRMAVWNDGVGISEDKIPLLFEKFSRIKQNAPMNVKGTGLGLFICRDIVERHGGKIWAESSYGNWISFIIEIPKYLKGGDKCLKKVYL